MISIGINYNTSPMIHIIIKDKNPIQMTTQMMGKQGPKNHHFKWETKCWSWGLGSRENLSLSVRSLRSVRS